MDAEGLRERLAEGDGLTEDEGLADPEGDALALGDRDADGDPTAWLNRVVHASHELLAPLAETPRGVVFGVTTDAMASSRKVLASTRSVNPLPNPVASVAVGHITTPMASWPADAGVTFGLVATVPNPLPTVLCEW